MQKPNPTLACRLGRSATVASLPLSMTDKTQPVHSTVAVPALGLPDLIHVDRLERAPPAAARHSTTRIAEDSLPIASSTFKARLDYT
eukprot:37018-Eustigmatos_ZCMA.PRE.1